ncbi:hypothetical protein [Maricaulis sp. MIT060901]|uniref:hypothetical protein n=1 Tax=Maricaulis sp. MIT060901 TaxID=3096993 RepID=UPI00399ADBB2
MKPLGLLFCLALLSVTPPAIAEDHPVLGRRVSTTTHHVQIPEDGSREEFFELSARWTERILGRNPYFADVRSLWMEADNGQHQLLVIYTYSETRPAGSLSEINARLMAEEWPDEAERRAFFARLGDYVGKARNTSGRFVELHTENVALSR